jgi:hypothetical protein
MLGWNIFWCGMGNLRWIGVRRHSLIATHAPAYPPKKRLHGMFDRISLLVCMRSRFELVSKQYRRKFIDTLDSIRQSSVVRSRSFDVDQRCSSHDSLRGVWSSDATGCLSSVADPTRANAALMSNG